MQQMVLKESDLDNLEWSINFMKNYEKKRKKKPRMSINQGLASK